MTRSEQVALLEGLAGRELKTPPAWLTKIGPAKAMGRSLRLSNRRFREVSGWRPTYSTPREGWSEVFRREAAAA